MLVGALWAGLAALLKATRGISEVISTIMLNFVATGVVAYLLTPGRLAVSVQGSNNIGTRPIPASAQVPGLPFPGASSTVFGFVIVAVLAGVGYTVLVNRTRFGFELRATGMASAAAVANGINAKRMTITTMLLSGAVAGLVGMPQLLGASYSYSLDFPTGLGFTGVAIALLGRNNAVGMALASLLWAFLDQSSLILDLDGIPKEIVVITQGVVVIFVVITYEVMRRRAVVQQQRQVRQDPAAPTMSNAGVPA